MTPKFNEWFTCTWHPGIGDSRLETIIFRFHVKPQGCISRHAKLQIQITMKLHSGSMMFEFTVYLVGAKYFVC